MSDPDVTAGTRQEYFNTLHESYKMRIHMDLYDLRTGAHIGSVANPDYSVVAGQVDVDHTADVSRQLSLDILDIDKALYFDPSAHQAPYPTKLIRVSYVVFVPTIGAHGRWVRHPVFTGPVSRVERDNDTVHIEAQGKESLMLPPVDTAPIWKLFDSAIHEVRKDRIPVTQFIKLAAKAAGETRFDLPQRNQPTLSRDTLHLHRQDFLQNGLWPSLRKLARACEMELLYSGDGHLTMKPMRTKKPVWVFHDGDRGNISTEPQVSWDLADFRNKVEIYVPSSNDSSKSTLAATWTLKNSPLSPWGLRRVNADGDAFPIALIDREDMDVQMNNDFDAEIDTLLGEGQPDRTKQRARGLAKRLGERQSQGALAVSFDALPVPILEPGDMCAIETESMGKRTHFVLSTFTLPLTPALMSIGYNRRISVR